MVIVSLGVCLPLLDLVNRRGEAGPYLFVAAPGIKYGVAQRWQPPSLVSSWGNQVYNATQYGACCFQNGYPTSSEDCLFLNIWTPSGNSIQTGPKSVMFYIHGGGWIYGCGSDAIYDGANFANSTDVIVVTINYRLAAFGLLALNDIRGNFALMDMQLALHWVNSYISAFGGNPNDVTLFGQSAGAISVGALVASPVSIKANNFARAIIQSSPFAVMFRSISEQQSHGQLFAALVGCPITDTQCLRHKTAAEILQVSMLDFKIDKFNWRSLVTEMPWLPTIDGNIVVENTIEAFASGNIANIPLMIGAVGNETLGWAADIVDRFDPSNYSSAPLLFEAITLAIWGPQFAPKIWATYNIPAHMSHSALTAVVGKIFSDFLFWCSQRYSSQKLMAVRPSQQVYLYNFLYGPPVDYMNNVPACHNYACHSVELAYVWNTQHHFAGVPFSAQQQALSTSISTMFAAFAKGNNMGQWNYISPQELPVWIWNIKGSAVQQDFDPEVCRLWDSVGYLKN